MRKNPNYWWAKDTLARACKQIREEQGLSQMEVSRRTAELGNPVPNRAISHFENGDLQYLTMDRLTTMFAVYGVETIEDFLNQVQ